MVTLKCATDDIYFVSSSVLNHDCRWLKGGQIPEVWIDNVDIEAVVTIDPVSLRIVVDRILNCDTVERDVWIDGSDVVLFSIGESAVDEAHIAGEEVRIRLTVTDKVSLRNDDVFGVLKVHGDSTRGHRVAIDH